MSLSFFFSGNPRLGRFLSPDPYVQAPDFSQSFNRYSYVWNNPLKYTDPTGEFINIAFFSFVFITKGLVNWANGESKPFAKAWNTASDATRTISSANQFDIYSNSNTTFYGNFNPFNLYFPGIGAVHKSGKMTFSGEVGLSPFGGWYSTGYVNYTNDKFSTTLGAGKGPNYWSVGGSITYNGYGGGYYHTWYGNALGPDGNPNPQNYGSIQYYWPKGSFRMENDLFARGNLDRWRTFAAELQVGDFVMGSRIYTNAPSRNREDRISYISIFWDMFGIGNNPKGAYSEGKVFSSPLYIGLRTGNVVSRIGWDHPVFQDIFQNGMHLLVKSPFFTTPYGGYSRPFWYGGYYNPFTLF